MVTAYLDHAATTALRPEARAAMEHTFDLIGNPSSVHAAGRRARRVVEDSREQVAALLGAHPTEVVFTSGATEANNLAIKGLGLGQPRAACAAIEHASVLEPMRRLAEQGVDVVELPVGSRGDLDPDVVGPVLGDGRGALVAIQAANAELGTLHDVHALVTAWPRALVHCDAAQGTTRLQSGFGELGVASLAVSAHKLGGPIGVGALLVRRDLRPSPLLDGGGQERGLRSGTVPLVLLAGFAAALQAAFAAREHEDTKLIALRGELLAGAASLDGLRLAEAGERHLPGVMLFTVAGAEGEVLLFLLDRAGICVSTGSACHAGVIGPNPVLLAAGYPPDAARGALRVSLGYPSTSDDIAALLAALPGAIAEARAAAGVAGRVVAQAHGPASVGAGR